MPSGIYIHLKRKEKKKNCKFCNNLFYFYPSMRKGIYCSKICYYKAQIGCILSETTKKKMSLTQIERIKNSPSALKHLHTPEAIKRALESRKGYHPTEETKRKIATSNMREKHWNWKGGITSIHQTIRVSDKIKKWKKQILERDNYTCQWCKQYSGKLNVDHIKPFAWYPNLRFELSNGRTLCINCHKWKTKMDWKIYTGKVPELNYI